MKPLEISQLHNVCKIIGNLKEQIIEELPHYGSQSLFLQSDEISTGQLNNKTEIKINLLTGQLLYFHNEEGHYVDLTSDELRPTLEQITQKFKLVLSDHDVEPVPLDQLLSFHYYAVHARRILELFRMSLSGHFTLVHLWPHHFDFSVEWFTGNKDEQIGTGISPGDKQYPEPYLYMNPYPFNENVTKNDLPIGSWHDSGWKGIKVDWNELTQYHYQEAANKVTELFDIAKRNFTS